MTTLEEMHSFVQGGSLAAVTGPATTAPGTAIILFADIVDSTALTERLGDDAFRQKARVLDEAMRSAIRDNGGSPVEGKTLGDGGSLYSRRRSKQSLAPWTATTRQMRVTCPSTPASTLAMLSVRPTTSTAAPSTSPHASVRYRRLVRCWSQTLSARWPARPLASLSKTAVSTR
jgi:class 3 adenylate cyclase